MEQWEFTPRGQTTGECLSQDSTSIDIGHRMMEGITKSPHGHTWRITVEYSGSLDINKIFKNLKEEFQRAFIFNVKDRTLLNIFKNNGFKVVEVNLDPSRAVIAEYVYNKIDSNNVKSITINNIKYIPHEQTEGDLQDGKTV